MAVFETRVRVRFADIDHAGIVYYPRIFHFFHCAFEEFFGDAGGIPYHEILDERKVGFPTVHSEADFRASLTFGEVARVTLEVDRIGTKSMTMFYRVFGEPNGDLKAEGRVTTACVNLDTWESMPIPDDLRDLFARYLREA